jgi:hypothetical protein
MSGHRPSQVSRDLLLQRAVRVLPQLPRVFTAKQLRRLLPDRSPDQCRRLLTLLVARGYCRPASKRASEVVNTTPPTTLSDRILALFRATTTITVAQALPVVGRSYDAAKAALAQMERAGLLACTLEATDRPPHRRKVYRLAHPIQRAPVAAPTGCRDPHCHCPLAESDYDVRNGRLVRTICRRHELTVDPEAPACSP